jgi:tetratricopeptide (TPR) repeat protein
MHQKLWSIIFLAYFASFAVQLQAQGGLPLPAIRQLKIGNSFREANQYERAEEYLNKGLANIRGKDKYWEAFAYESLGILHKEMGENPLAVQNFNKALNLYNELGMQLSAKLVQSIRDGIEGKKETFAGIEIGSKGVKFVIVSMIINPNKRYQFKVEVDSSRNVDIINGKPENIAAAAKAVRFYYYSQALGKHKLSDDKIFIVFSSGAKDNLSKIDKFRTAYQVVKDSLNLPTRAIDSLTACQEAEYLARGIMPNAELYTSTVLDIGSGNTKGGYVAKQAPRFRCFDLDYGSVSLSQKIKALATQENLSYAQAAKKIEPSVRDAVRKKFAAGDGLIAKSKNKVWVVGGIAYAMVTYIYPAQIKEVWPRMYPKDVERFSAMAMVDYEKLTNPELSAYSPDIRDAAGKEAKRVREKVFNQETLIAGSIILNAIFSEFSATTSSGAKEKEFYFNRDGYIGWITGYMVEAVKKRYDDTAVKE